MMGFTGTGGAVGLWGESRRPFSPLAAAVAGSFADPLALLFFPLFDDFVFFLAGLPRVEGLDVEGPA